MSCTACGEQPKNTAKDFTKAVIEINNPEETIVLLRKVVIPASMGTEEQVPAAIGKYKNVILYYEANKHVYFYSSDGIPTHLEVEIPEEIYEAIDGLQHELAAEAITRGNADIALQKEIDEIKDNPDVVDIVATYADLQAYDTSKLTDNDVIRVLTDETHDGSSSYYRWNKTTSAWSFIGITGPYYTKTETDTLLGTKQNTLTFDDTPTTASNNPVKSYGIKSYVDGVIIKGNTAPTTSTVGTVGLLYEDTSTGTLYILESIDTSVTPNTYNWDLVGPEVVQTPGVSQEDVMSQNATTSMIFSDPSVRRHIMIGDGATNTGAGDGSVAIGYSAHAHGDTISIGTDSGNNLAQANNQINIGHGAGNDSNYGHSISIGYYAEADNISTIAIGSSSSASDNAKATKMSAIAIGVAAKANGARSVALGNGALVDSIGTRSIALEGQCYARGAVALGAGSAANTEGTVDVGAAWHMNGETWGYLGSDYRRITGVYDGQALHDAATLAQGNTLSDSAPTTSTVGVLGQLYTDTTNMHTYQCTYIDDSDPNVNPVYTWTQRW